jgi:hypothetical protein
MQHKGKTLTERHRKSFTMLCTHLGCLEGETLSRVHQAGPTITDLHSFLRKYTHMRTTGLIDIHNAEHEDEDNRRSILDPPIDRSGKFRLPKKVRRKKLKPRPNPDTRPHPSASSVHGLGE